MAIGTRQYLAKLAVWLTAFKSHSNFTSLSAPLKEADQPQSYLIKIKQVSGLKPPQDLSAQTDLQYNLQAVYTLYSKSQGFFGRSQVSSVFTLSNQMKLENEDFVLFNTKVNDPDVVLIVEYLLIVRKAKARDGQESPKDQITDESQKWEEYKRFGIGFSQVSLFTNQVQSNAELYQGSSRQLLSGKTEFFKTGCQIDYELSKSEDYMCLVNLVRENCLLGPLEIIPGLIQSSLPRELSQFQGVRSVCQTKAIFAHNLSISSMQQVETSFNQFLRQLCISDEQTTNSSQPIRAQIMERKLKVVPHNTWKQMGLPSAISLSKDEKGQIQTTGSLKIPEFLLHSQISLVFKLEYKVKITEKSQNERQQDFVLGWCHYIPTLIKNNTEVQETEISLDLVMGPGVSLTGEVMWDQTLTKKSSQDSKFKVKLSALITTKEAQQTTQPAPKPEVGKVSSALESQLGKIRQSVRDQELQAQKDNERLQKLEQQNEQLRKEKKELMSINQAPVEQTIKQIPENQELEKAKEYYQTKNTEIEKLIQQVLNGHREPSDLPQDKPLSPESVESLLKYLIYIVLHKEGGSNTDETKQSLLDLLKSDENLRQQLFGQLAQQGKQQLSKEDCTELARLGLINAQQCQLQDMYQVNMEQEMRDGLPQSLFTIKFVAFKTPSSKKAPLPTKMFFTFKFFTNDAVQTEAVQLHTTEQQELKLATQYYLVVPEQLRVKQLQNQNIDSVLESALYEKFEVLEDQRSQFLQYLKDQSIAIEVWDAATQTHYGTGRLNLIKMLRQGNPTKVNATEVELYEKSMNEYVGTLQVMMTNEGKQNQRQKSVEPQVQRATSSVERPASAAPIKSKKVYSKPVDRPNTAVVAKTTSDSVPNANEITEEQRKKLRVQRLRQQTAAVELSTGVMNDDTSDEWAKRQALRQIQMVREMKKKQLLV